MSDQISVTKPLFHGQFVHGQLTWLVLLKGGDMHIEWRLVDVMGGHKSVNR